MTAGATTGGTDGGAQEWLTVRSAAKINLHLGVAAPRDDGFHPLDTVFHAVGLHDDLTARAASYVQLSVGGAPHVSLDSVPGGADNIVHRAVTAMALHHGRDLPLEIDLHKTIPVAGGMAGGSADAAAALVLADRWHDLHTPDEDLLALAAELGSDVPFALLGGTARGTGRGEVVEPIDDRGAWWWVVVPAAVGLPTPEVYRHFDRLRTDAPDTPASSRPVVEAVASGEPLRLARAMHNDLEEPAVDLRPELGDLIDRGSAAGALRGMVSGSGPTVVFLADGREGADALAHELQAHHDVVLVTHGPAAGAHVVGTEL